MSIKTFNCLYVYVYIYNSSLSRQGLSILVIFKIRSHCMTNLGNSKGFTYFYLFFANVGIVGLSLPEGLLSFT